MYIVIVLQAQIYKKPALDSTKDKSLCSAYRGTSPLENFHQLGYVQAKEL